MTLEQSTNHSAMNASGTDNLPLLVEHLADSVWKITETRSDYALVTVAAPLTRAMDEIGLQLHFILGMAPVKQHLQHLKNGLRNLVPVEYYLQRAYRRGLMEGVSRSSCARS